MLESECKALIELGENPLDLSVWKFIDIVYFNGKDLARDNCALCQTHKYCIGCPIFKDTGLKGCANTPYDDYDCCPSDTLAEEELEYLLNLLETKEAMEIIDRKFAQ